MVLCQHCDSDMDMISLVESENYGSHFYEECIYECPLCYNKYRVVDKFILADRKMEKME